MDSLSYLQKNVQCVFHAPCSMVILRMFFNNSRLVNHSYSLVVAGGSPIFLNFFFYQNFGEIHGIQLDLRKRLHMFQLNGWKENHQLSFEANGHTLYPDVYALDYSPYPREQSPPGASAIPS